MEALEIWERLMILFLASPLITTLLFLLFSKNE